MDSLVFKEQFDALPGRVVITDPESRVVYANRAAQRRTGFAIGEIVGKKPGELWGGNMERSFYQSMWQTISEEKRPFTGVVNNIKKNGTPYEEHLFIMPILDEKREIQYFIHIHPDMEDQVKERLFSNEFFRQADPADVKKDQLPWLLDTMSQKRDGTRVKIETPETSENSRGLAAIFYEFLIRPVEQIFFRRHEDAVLIARAQEDPKQFSALYEKYYLLVKQYLMKRLNNDPDISMDLTQEVFSRAFSHLVDFRIGNASYLTYLLRVAHNILVNYYRKESNADLFIAQEKATSFIEIPKFHTEVSFEGILKQLSKKEREIMLMKYQDDMKIEEIALKVGKSQNAIKLILSRARKKLKNGS